MTTRYRFQVTGPLRHDIPIEIVRRPKPVLPPDTSQHHIVRVNNMVEPTPAQERRATWFTFAYPYIGAAFVLALPFLWWVLSRWQ